MAPDLKHMEIILAQGQELIEFYRMNPCVAAYDLLGVDLAPIQRIVFEDMWFKNYTISIMGRGCGKSYMLGVLSVLSCLLFPGYRVGLIGPIFRQSKMIFSEVEKLYNKSSILREACAKRPTRASDSCYLQFKSIGNASGSFIEALPLGVDGSKIRGSRFYLICVDEIAQVPDKIVDLVIRPFAATTLEPMENVRNLEKQKRLIEEGLATEEDFEDKKVNKMIMTTSGYYKFNHIWRRMKDYWRQMDEYGNKSQYIVHQIPYQLMPEGFLDMNNIKEAKRIMSNAEYMMEYEAVMISDSEGFFKASLLEECTRDSNFSLELKGTTDSRYIVGVDPNQGGSASCGAVIVKLGKENKVVNVLEIKKQTTQDLTKAVQDICDKYNIIRIFMDKGGGGKAICDLLEEGYNGHEPIIDRTNKDHTQMKGKHILEMVNFSPSWISDANFSTLSLLEDKRLQFPEPPTSTIDSEAIAYDRINKLKLQMLNIIVTQTSSGLLHFDTPKKGQNKDLYSAIILAGYGIRYVEKEIEEDSNHIELQNSGVIREHTPGSSWRGIGNSSGNINKQNGLEFAVLKRKK